MTRLRPQAIIVFIQNYRTQAVDTGYVLAAMMCVASFFVALGKAHSYQRVTILSPCLHSPRRAASSPVALAIPPAH
jgi:hypothetical protein